MPTAPTARATRAHRRTSFARAACKTLSEGKKTAKALGLEIPSSVLEFNLPPVRRAMRQHDMTDREKFWADWLLFVGAAMCPTDVNFFSKGFCEHPRFIEDLIDFEKLRHVRASIEISAFDIKQHKIVDFKNRDARNRPTRIRVEHLRAALSFPLIYPPYELDGRLFYEGAAFEALNAPEDINEIDRFIILNPFRPNLVRAPDNLWEAYTQSIIMPVVGIAESEVESDRRTRPIDVSWIYYRGALDQIMTTLRMPLKKADTKAGLSTLKDQLERKEWYSAELMIDDRDVPDALGWKRSSLQRLFRIGHHAGKKLAKRLRNEHPTYTGHELARLAGASI